MIRLLLRLPLDYTPQAPQKAVIRRLNILPADLLSLSLVKRSVDARHKERVVFQLTVDVSLRRDEDQIVRAFSCSDVQKVVPAPIPSSAFPSWRGQRPIVVGGGPAGLFAALTLARAGARPLLIERGENVDARVSSVKQFRLSGKLDPESNVLFGEGGAGTFSDGKLHSGISDSRCRQVLEELANAGAPPEILWQAKPHIGTDKLVAVVRGLRRQIEALSGEVRFGWKLIRLLFENDQLEGMVVQTPDSEVTLSCDRLILAIGHSARDTLQQLYADGLPMTRKPFAVGVRIEHPRAQIDRTQYGRFAGHPALGAADYKLSCHPAGGRGVYTFCMCPGGEVIASASEPGGVAVNGMSLFARDAVNSNSALLVGVEPSDLPGDDPLVGIAFQREMEQRAFALGGGDFRAPVQLVGDFLAGRPSTALGVVTPSYRPGVTLSDLRDCLPAFVASSLRAALPLFGQRLKGFDRYDALLTGVETRSSSPVRLLRSPGGQSAVRGVYPCGEGAGYAGSITSAAVDGIRCAQWMLQAVAANDGRL